MQSHKKQSVMKKNILRILSIFLLTGFLSVTAIAGTGTVTVKLHASDGFTGVANATVKYYKSGQQTLGTTDANGEWSGVISDIANSTTFYVYPQSGGAKIWLNIDPATNPTLTVQMVAVTIDLKDCDGNALAGEAQYYKSGWQTIGNTPATIDLLPYTGLGPGQGNYDFKVKYNGRTSATNRQDISVDQTVDFTTTRVDFSYSGPIQYYNGGWQTVTGPIELIGGTQNYGGNPVSKAEFRFGNPVVYQAWFDITGCNVGGALIQLVDETGSPVANGDVGGINNLSYRSRCGGSWTYNYVSFTTDANGFAILNTSCTNNNWDGKITVRVNATSKEQVVATNSVYQLSRVNVNLNTCNPSAPLAGGVVKYQVGGWPTIGTTDASGNVNFLAFDGNNVGVRMSYNVKGTEQRSGIPVSFPVTNIDFTTTTVTFNYPGTIQINAGGWPVITTPIELLPGDYIFRFDGNQTGTIAISGCEFEKSFVVFKLLDSNGNGLAGGVAKYSSGGWQTIGTTPSNGTITALLDGSLGNTKFRVEYGGHACEKWQDVSVNPTVVFNTVSVTMKLLKSDNVTELAGTSKYSGGGWQQFGTGTTTTTMELLPKNIKFRVEYGGHACEKWQDVSVNSTVVFNTVLVTMKLLKSDNMTELAGTSKYSGGGWQQFGTGTTTTTMELLPKNIKFRVEYGGHACEKWQDVSVNPTVVFNTVSVTMKLLKSDNVTELAGTSKYSGGGWQQFGTGTTTTTMELLPKNIKFRVEYGGHACEKWQDVSVNSTVVFNTVLVTMKLLKSDNMTELAGTSKYSGGGWQQFGTGTTTTTMELLPKNIKFRVEYGGHACEKWQDVSVSSTVVFNTVLVTMKLLDTNNGNAELGGTAKYSGGGWQQFGTGTTTTDMELLPKNIKFRVEYSGDAKEKWQDVSVNPNVDFTWDGSNLNRLAGEENTYKLENNYPNPFDRFTTINYSIPEDRKVSLMIYDWNGKLVKVLVDEFKDSGDYQVEWDARDESGNLVPGGIYYYRFKSGTLDETRNMIRVH